MEVPTSNSGQSREKQFADELARLRKLAWRARIGRSEFGSVLPHNETIGYLAKAVEGLIDLVEANVNVRTGDAVGVHVVAASTDADGVHVVGASSDAVGVAATENAAAISDNRGAKTSGGDIEGGGKGDNSGDSESDDASDSDSPLDASGHLPWDDGDQHERATAQMWDEVVSGTIAAGEGESAAVASREEYDRAYAELRKEGKDPEEIEAILGARPILVHLPIAMLEKSRERLAAKAQKPAVSAEIQAAFDRTTPLSRVGSATKPSPDFLENWTPQSHPRLQPHAVIDQQDEARVDARFDEMWLNAAKKAAVSASAEVATPDEADAAKATATPLKERPSAEKPKKKRSRSPRLDRDGYLPWDESDYHEQMVGDMWTREMLDRVDAAADYDIDADALRKKGVSGAEIEGRLGRRPRVTQDEIARAAELRSGPNKAAYALNSKNDIEDAPNRPAARGAEKRAELAKKNTDDDAAMMRLLMSTPLTAQSTSAGKRADSVSLEDDDLLEDPWNSEDEGQRRWDDEF